MTYIKTTSEDIAGIGFSYPMAERYEQRLLQALRTAEKTIIIQGSYFTACNIVAPLRCMSVNGKLALEQQKAVGKIEGNHGRRYTDYEEALCK